MYSVTLASLHRTQNVFSCCFFYTAPIYCFMLLSPFQSNFTVICCIKSFINLMSTISSLYYPLLKMLFFSDGMIMNHLLLFFFLFSFILFYPHSTIQILFSYSYTHILLPGIVRVCCPSPPPPPTPPCSNLAGIVRVGCPGPGGEGRP